MYRTNNTNLQISKVKLSIKQSKIFLIQSLNRKYKRFSTGQILTFKTEAFIEYNINWRICSAPEKCINNNISDYMDGYAPRYCSSIWTGSRRLGRDWPLFVDPYPSSKRRIGTFSQS